MKRRAASPVIAELLLLCIAILVAIPVGSFVFGLMKSNSTVAEVEVASSACSTAGTNSTSCTFSLTNQGTKNAQFQPYSIIMILHGNQTTQDSSTACSGEGGNTIAAGSTLKVDCRFNLVPGNAGDQYTGWLSITGVGWIPFAGRF